MKKVIISFSIFTFLLVLCIQNTSAQSKAYISVKSQTIIENEIIYLRDIAKISGKQESVELLKKISLGYSPNVGMVREIPVRKLNLSIAAAGFSPNDFSISSPEKIFVKRASQKIEEIQIRESVKKAIFKQFEDSEISISILRLDIPASVEAPLGNAEINTDLSKIRNVFAPFYLPIEIRINGKRYRLISAKVEIEAFAEVFVAANDLAKNKRVKVSDAVLKKIRLKKPLLSYLYKKEDLRGIKTIRDLSKNSVLTRDSIVKDIVIKSGDLVRIVGQSGKLQLVVTGEARASGRIGDRITVKNLQSKKIIQATVFDEGVVKIFF